MTSATAIKCCPSFGGSLRRHHPGVELAAQFASTSENSTGSDVHGRSQLVESFVWFIPFLCVKRREKREERRDKMKNNHKVFGK